jgi:hypothetical protein
MPMTPLRRQARVARNCSASNQFRGRKISGRLSHSLRQLRLLWKARDWKGIMVKRRIVVCANKVLHDAARTMVKRTTVVCANRVLHDAARALVKRRTVVCANRVLHDCGLCQTYGLA